MQINNATLNGLRTTFSLQFQTAYKAANDVWWNKVATKVPSSTATNTYGWMANRINLREWTGARVAQNLSAHAATYTNKPYEGTVEVDRDDIEDDNLGVYSAITMPEFGIAVAKHPDELIRAMLASNPTMWDGKALFADDHPTYDVTEAVTTYDNNLALALTADNFETARITRRRYIGENGKVLGVKSNLLIVPPSLERKAKEIVIAAQTIKPVYNVAETEIVAAGMLDNVSVGSADILVIDELEDDPTAWYLADTTRPLKPFLFQMRREAQFVAKDSPTDDNVFTKKKFVYGVEGRWTVGATLPWLITKSKP